MSKDDRIQRGILGDINPEPSDHVRDEEARGLGHEEIESMRDRPEHSGARDVTKGIGGTGAEVGGTRNYRQGTGATGGDIGNRPE